MMNISEVRLFWSLRAGEAVGEEEVTHRDVWQRWLEVETIKKFLDKSQRVIDIGCGNGFTTKTIATFVREIVGMDYTEEMIKRAARPEYGQPLHNVSFHVGDVMRLSPEMFGLFDLAISERCLINLADWNSQKKAIANIASVIKPGGTLLFIEGSADGRAGLNRLRESVGLEPMPKVWHNIDFEEKQLYNYLNEYFTVGRNIHFGVYDYISRVTHPLLVAPEQPKYDSPMNKVAAYLALKSQDIEARSSEFRDISRALFLVLKRKPN